MLKKLHKGGAPGQKCEDDTYNNQPFSDFPCNLADKAEYYQDNCEDEEDEAKAENPRSRHRRRFFVCGTI
jgi:hypothetical protein